MIAELFYELHSFILECTAFLATWLVLDAAVRVAVDRRARARAIPATEPAASPGSIDSRSIPR